MIRQAGGSTVRATLLRGERRILKADPLDAVREMLLPFMQAPEPGLPPFQGGALGFVGYGYGRSLEQIPAARHRDVNLPDVCMGLYDWVIAWDHVQGQCWIISTGIPDAGAAQNKRAAERMELVRRVAERPGPGSGEQGAGIRTTGNEEWGAGNGVEHRVVVEGCPLRSGFSHDGYMQAVEFVIRYILSGDVFQVNLSQRFTAPLAGDPIEYYRRLRTRTPADFAAYLDYGEFQLACASPERFLAFDPGTRLVETRPIKGTRPRGDTPERDAGLARELSESAKDQAENVMIVDLLRNDLSKVCRPGTVEVPEILAVESHPALHHLVSTVTGALDDGFDPPDLLRACFPGGSITGAPKIRAMEIIAELEPVAREAYTGSIGYWSLGGAMDTNIVIRTAIIAGGSCCIHGGGGIVADSDPAREYDETLDKVRALVRALER